MSYMMCAIRSPSRCAHAANSRANPLRRAVVELAHQPQVQQRQLVVRRDEDVPRVQVGVHEAVLEDHLHQRRQPEARHPLRVGAGGRSRQNLGSDNKRHRQDAFRRQGVDHLGEDDRRLGLEVGAEPAVVAGLDAEIELRRTPRARTPPAPRRGPGSANDGTSASSFAQARMTTRSNVQISTTFGRRTLTATMRPSGSRALWTCDTDADAIGTGANSAKIGAQRPPEVGLDGAHDVLDREGADVILQLGERGGDVFGQHVGARAHDLPYLDVGRAQLAAQIDDDAPEPGTPRRLALAPQPQRRPPETKPRAVLAEHENNEDCARPQPPAQRLPGHR